MTKPSDKVLRNTLVKGLQHKFSLNPPKYPVLNLAFSSTDSIVTLHYLQVIMLSFCRGEILPKFDRSSMSFESSVMPGLLQNYDFTRIKKPLPEKDRRRVYRRILKHPEANIPPDCYVFYSTLPDSK